MSRPKKRVPRVTVRRVKDHPRPYESPLRPHLDAIRAMRRAHKTWQEIAQHLNEAHGLKTSFTTVYNFFKRVTERAKKGKGPLPLGYEDDAVRPQPAAPPPVPSGPPRASEAYASIEDDPELRPIEPPKEETINERKRRLYREQQEREQREKR